MNVDEMRTALAQLTLQYFNQSRGLERMARDIDTLQAAIDGYTKGQEDGLGKDQKLPRE